MIFSKIFTYFHIYLIYIFLFLLESHSLDTEKLITEIVPKISESIKNDSVAPGIINEMIEMFGSKNDVKNILKMAHQTNEGTKELKKISAHFFEGTYVKKIKVKILDLEQHKF